MFFRVKETGHSCTSQLYSEDKKKRLRLERGNPEEKMQCSFYFSINNTFVFSFHLRNQIPFLLSSPEGFLPFFSTGEKEIDWNIYFINLTHFGLNPTDFSSLSQIGRAHV